MKTTIKCDMRLGEKYIKHGEKTDTIELAKTLKYLLDML